jgi:hypothetical protein
VRSLTRRVKALESKSENNSPVIVIHGEATLLENVQFVFMGTPGMTLEDCIKAHGVEEITHND